MSSIPFPSLKEGKGEDISRVLFEVFRCECLMITRFLNIGAVQAVQVLDEIIQVFNYVT